MKVGPKICGERRDVYEPMGNTDSEDEESETLPTGGLRGFGGFGVLGFWGFWGLGFRVLGFGV